MFLQGKKLIEISEILNIPEGTVRRWKHSYKWDSERSDKKSERSHKKRGGQLGNKNAYGHGAPEQNKNAVKTGEFETLLFDCMDPEELQLANAVPLDKEQLLLQEIQLLTVREHRMLKRIEGIKNTVEHLENGAVDGMTMVSFKSGLEKGNITELKEYQGKLGQIQTIEDALTRVQARKQRAIETLHKFGYDDAHLELETMKFEMELLKQGGEDENTDDDGFLVAMNATAADVWGDEDV